MVTLKSFVYALRGIRHVLKHERNARFHLLVAVAVVAFSVGISILLPEEALSLGEFAAIVFAIFLVFLAEILNTALEAVVDMVRPNAKHAQAGVVKDIMAGGVLVASIAAFLIGLIVFLPRLLDLVGMITPALLG